MSEAGATRAPASGLDFDLVGRAALFVVTLLVFWVTLEPLKDLSDGAVLGTSESSDAMNQLVFLTLFVLCAGTLATMGWRRLAPLAHPAYAAVLGWFLIGCAFAINPGISVRRLVLSVMVIFIVGVLLLLPRTQRQFESWLGGVALAVVVLCHLAVLLLPHLAVHQTDAAMETNLAGSWRGIYGHKSLAGPMMIVFMLIGVFLTTQGRVMLGPALTALSAVFLLFTGAKQPQALVAWVFLLSWLCSRTTSARWLLALCLVPLSLYLTFTVGSAIFPWVAEFNGSVMSDPTFTNRTGIWKFALGHFSHRPLFGYGFLGFWNTEYVRYTAGIDDNSWAATASHSHDSYLDLALTTGLPGLALACWALVVLPILDFARARRVPENRAAALLFFRIWLFGVFLASLETLFFRRDDAFWVAFLLAIFGLRFLATQRMRTKDDPAAA